MYLISLESSFLLFVHLCECIRMGICDVGVASCLRHVCASVLALCFMLSTCVHVYVAHVSVWMCGCMKYVCCMCTCMNMNWVVCTTFLTFMCVKVGVHYGQFMCDMCDMHVMVCVFVYMCMFLMCVCICDILVGRQGDFKLCFCVYMCVCVCVHVHRRIRN